MNKLVDNHGNNIGLTTFTNLKRKGFRIMTLQSSWFGKYHWPLQSSCLVKCHSKFGNFVSLRYLCLRCNEQYFCGAAMMSTATAVIDVKHGAQSTAMAVVRSMATWNRQECNDECGHLGHKELLLCYNVA